MATYNLNAADLITLLASSVQSNTAGKILQALEQNGSFPKFSNTYKVAAIADPTGGSATTQRLTVPSATSLALIDLPSSTTTTGSGFANPSIGGATLQTVFGITTSGGVVIGAGDQAVLVRDFGPGGDTLVGGDGYEKLSSLSTSTPAGGNVLIGGSGLNTLQGGAGPDTLIGGGQSREIAGSGITLVIGGVTSTFVAPDASTKTTSDTLFGGPGQDTLSVSFGNNRLFAGGANSLLAGAGNDTLLGASGATMQGATGNTRFMTYAGPETVLAGSGSDTVVAMDTSGLLNVTGGPGALRVVDTIGAGGSTGASLTLQGGAGTERVLLGITGTDSITSNGSSTSSISALSYQSASNLTSNSSSVAGGTHTLTFLNGQVIVVNDVNHNITLNFNGGGSAVV